MSQKYATRRNFKQANPEEVITSQMQELSNRIAACTDMDILKALGAELVQLTKGNTYQFTYMQTKYSRRKEHIQVLNKINKCQHS